MARTLNGYDAPYGFTAMGVTFDPLSATMATVLSGVGAVGKIGSTLAGMGSAMEAGRAGKAGALAEAQLAVQSANYKATQLRQQAQEARASAQRMALETQRKGDLAQSTLRARAAAGGGKATDNTVLNLAGQIAGRTEYESLLDMYKGENSARGLEDAADAAIWQGDIAKQAAGLKVRGIGAQTQGTIASSVGSLASSIGGLGSTMSGINWGGGGPTMPDMSSFTSGQIMGRKSVYD